MCRTFKVVSLFCGAGGIDMGFSRAGFKTIWANDIDKAACATFKRWNRDAQVVIGDVTRIEAETIPRADVILGGFPCQGFSVGGKRDPSDPRNKLYKQYVRIVDDLQPLAFIGENVKGLLKMDGGAIYKRIVEDFASCGYKIFCELLDAVDYGVPQNRKRVIIVGFRNDLNVSTFDFPEPEKERRTLADAIGGLQISDPRDRGRFYVRRRDNSRLSCMKRAWNHPSLTITATELGIPVHPDSPDAQVIESTYTNRRGEVLPTRRWVFDLERARKLSWQECAAIQTFPIGMEFEGCLADKFKQIGNAVPPLLAEKIAAQVYKKLITNA